MESFAMQGESIFMTVDGGRRVYTTEDIEALPEGERAELINGEMFMMATPTTTHQRVIGWLYVKIYSHIENRKGKCNALLSPFGVFIKNDDKNYVEPDIVVICDRDKLDDKGCHGAPDWVLEVVSPSSKSMDYYKKLDLYSNSGVREYWIIDVSKETIIVYDLEHEEAPAIYHFTDMIKSRILTDLEIDFGELKERLAD